MLQTSIADISRLDQEPLTEPVPIVDDSVVPIEELFYRGRSAVERALEIRSEVKQGGGAPSAEQLDEIFDLLELAASD